MRLIHLDANIGGMTSRWSTPPTLTVMAPMGIARVDVITLVEGVAEDPAPGSDTASGWSRQNGCESNLRRQCMRPARDPEVFAHTHTHSPIHVCVLESQRVIIISVIHQYK